MPKLDRSQATVPVKSGTVAPSGLHRHSRYYDIPVKNTDTSINILAVDPGSERTGIALGLYDNGEVQELSTAIVTPSEFRVWFMSAIGCIHLVVAEDWRLRPDTARAMIGSDFPTVKLLGWLEYTIEDFGDIEYQKNPVHVRKGTASVLKHSGVPLVSPGKVTDSHMNDAMSAELHFWYAMIKNGMIDGLKIDNLPK